MVTRESWDHYLSAPNGDGTPRKNPAAHWPVAFGAGMTLVHSGQSLPGVMLCQAEMDGSSVTLTAHTKIPTPKAPEKSLALRFFELLELWRRRWSDRRLLSGLDDRMLKDMGVSSIDALRESSKPFWLK